MFRRPNLAQLFEFVNHHYVDEEFLLQLPHVYKDQTFELRWQYQSKEPRWSLQHKDAPQTNRKICTPELISILRAERVNLVYTQSKLTEKILARLAYLNLVLTEGKRLFGQATIQQTAKDLTNFAKKIKHAMRKTVN